MRDRPFSSLHRDTLKEMEHPPVEYMQDLEIAFQTLLILNIGLIGAFIIYAVIVEILKSKFAPFEGFVDFAQFNNLDYSRAEVGADARRQPMKLWSSTANGLQRSRCGKIGSPLG